MTLLQNIVFYLVYLVFCFPFWLALTCIIHAEITKLAKKRYADIPKVLDKILYAISFLISVIILFVVINFLGSGHASDEPSRWDYMNVGK